MQKIFYLLLIPAAFIITIYNLENTLFSAFSYTDLYSFIDAGRCLELGINPYDKSCFTGPVPNLNSPVSLFLFEFFPTDDAVGFSGLWYLVTVLIFVICLGVLAGICKPTAIVPLLLWSIASAPLWYTLATGQIYVLLLACVILSFYLQLQQRRLLAGTAASLLIALKPSFILWPLASSLLGGIRFSIGAVLGSIVLIALALARYGFAVFDSWWGLAFKSLPVDGYWGHAAQTSIVPVIQSLLGTEVAMILIGLALIGCVVLKRAQPLTSLDQWQLGLCFALLFAPISWIGYGLFLLPLIYSSDMTNLWTRYGLLLLIIPVNFVHEFKGLWVLLYPLAIVLILSPKYFVATTEVDSESHLSDSGHLRSH